MSLDVLEISAQNFTLTDSIKDHVIAKMNKVISHDDSIVKLDVVLKEEKHNDNIGNMQAKANLAFHKHHIHHEVKGEDMYQSITELSEHLVREIRKEHRKFNSDRRDALNPEK